MMSRVYVRVSRNLAWKSHECNGITSDFDAEGNLTGLVFDSPLEVLLDGKQINLNPKPVIQAGQPVYVAADPGKIADVEKRLKSCENRLEYLGDRHPQIERRLLHEIPSRFDEHGKTFEDHRKQLRMLHSLAANIVERVDRLDRRIHGYCVGDTQATETPVNHGPETSGIPLVNPRQGWTKLKPGELPDPPEQIVDDDAFHKGFAKSVCDGIEKIRAEEHAPITEEWLLSVGFVIWGAACCEFPKSAIHTAANFIISRTFKNGDEWRCHTLEVIELRTRRDVRLLCELLRIELKEGT